jgi:DinB family protein
MPLLGGDGTMNDVTSQIAAWGRRSRAVRLERLSATANELAAMVHGVDAATLARRPAADAWAAVEVVCHLRDLEESFHDRLTLMVVADEPRFPTTHPGRWAIERQYLRHDASAAAAAFATRRTETLQLLDELPPAGWERAGYQVDSRGRRTVDDFLTVMAWHDENHLAQLARALEQRP